MWHVEPVLWGLACAVMWGVGDVFGRSASMRVGSPTMSWAIQGMGVFPALAGFLLFDESWDALATANYAALAVATAVLFSVGYIVFYRGLARGLVSIVSPVSAGYVVVAALVSAVFFHETIGFDRWMLILVIMAGIALASTRGRSRATLSGVGHGVTAMIVMGIAISLWKPMVDASGPFLAVVSVRIISAVMLGGFLAAMRAQWSPFRNGAGVFVIAAALLDSVGFIVFNFSIERNPVSLIIPIAAAYPVVTVALAWVLVRERLARTQVVGVAVVMGGIVAFSAAA
ncbi:MAG: EamA family transporter [Chloroflexota bacterium]|nr:EamA family transporter [Chloroflexota bacterium]MDE2940783.1 EamA family transporter [Chloroflexota bacterium]MDE3266965.1 EamA family transporter [Chloroflexota bacterium]